MLAQFFHPHVHFLKRVHVCDIVDYQCSLCSSIVDGVETVVLLLPGRVPNGQLVPLGPSCYYPSCSLIHSHSLFKACGVECRLLAVIELVLAESHGTGGLTDSRYIQNYKYSSSQITQKHETRTYLHRAQQFCKWQRYSPLL